MGGHRDGIFHGRLLKDVQARLGAYAFQGGKPLFLKDALRYAACDCSSYFHAKGPRQLGDPTAEREGNDRQDVFRVVWPQRGAVDLAQGGEKAEMKPHQGDGLPAHCDGGHADIDGQAYASFR